MDNTNENFNALHLLPKGKSFRQRMINEASETKKHIPPVFETKTVYFGINQDIA